MKTSLKAAITLIFITPVITEVLTSNTPIIRFLRPEYFLFLTIGYMPVLIIREISARLKLNLLGLALLGIAYGIYNEGIYAQSILLYTKVPLPFFDRYGFFFGINFTWAAVIILWHMLFSVFYPISIVHFLYPEVRNQPWLSKKTICVLLVPITLIGALLFLHHHKYSPVYLLVFSAFIILLFSLARFFTDYSKEDCAAKAFSLKPLIFGVFFILFFLVSFVLAELKVSLALFYSYYFGALLLVYFFLKRKGWLGSPNFLLFGIGSYMSFLLISLKGVNVYGPTLVYTVVVFESVFVILVLMIRKRILDSACK